MIKVRGMDERLGLVLRRYFERVRRCRLNQRFGGRYFEWARGRCSVFSEIARRRRDDQAEGRSMEISTLCVQGEARGG